MSYDEREEMEAELEQLRAALQPFAEHADEIERRESCGVAGFRFEDNWPNPCHYGLTVGMFRKARAVLGKEASDDSVSQIMAAPSEVMPAAKS
jgi:hypothetical protein